MDALAVLRLSASPRRHNIGHGYIADDDEYALSTPYASAPSSPRRAFVKAGVEELPLGEVRAAVPFVWELVPGKPKNDVEGGQAESSVSSDETEDSGPQGRDSSSSRGGSVTTESTLSRDSSHTEFEFSSRYVGVVEPLPCRAAEELFSNGQLLPLRLPPRLQAVKNLRNSDSSCSDSGYSSGSFQTCLSSQSPRIAGSPKKSISVFAFTKTAEEMAVVAVQERKLQRPSSLAPLLLLNRENSPSGSNLSSDPASSASSSSSFPERNADTPQCSPESEENPQGSTLKDLLFTDIAMASMRFENLKLNTSPKLVQSRRELLKKQQEEWNGLADAQNVDEPATPALISDVPPLSRSNARSRPSIDVEVKSSQKENVGRAIFANKFGMLCSCMGMAALPVSP